MLDRYKKDILPDEFACQRMLKDRENKSLASGFSCERNPNLAWYLKQTAWRDDTQNRRAVYLVREKMKIVMFFSLQCGILVKCHQKKLGGVVNKGSEHDPQYYIDTEIIEVTESIPAIEMAHFCINDSYRKKKKTWFISHKGKKYKVGAYCFYTFIAPIILNLAELSGAQYVYLFCADDGSNKLKEYYSTDLRFEKMDNMACIRSKYDDKLECMTMKIKDLRTYLSEFNS